MSAALCMSFYAGDGNAANQDAPNAARIHSDTHTLTHKQTKHTVTHFRMGSFTGFLTHALFRQRAFNKADITELHHSAGSVLLVCAVCIRCKVPGGTDRKQQIHLSQERIKHKRSLSHTVLYIKTQCGTQSRSPRTQLKCLFFHLDMER